MQGGHWEAARVRVVLYQNGSLIFVSRNHSSYLGLLEDRVSGKDRDPIGAATRIASELLRVEIKDCRELVTRYTDIGEETFVAMSYVLAEAATTPNPLPGHGFECVPRGQMPKFRRKHVIGSDIEEMIELALKERA